MGLNQKAEDGSLREAKKGRATVFPDASIVALKDLHPTSSRVVTTAQCRRKRRCCYPKTEN
ncbi:hypothetical protein PVK06_009293 [Gossypium arboreum]|uniref:Uncharacterized protein n=1 Tax=Gossypium arboreum TaxID=29729 RepID=A0ABR0QN27_GOSAR|nr:hypothetical protein PVK06_009293 [Gossypium arboreum]